MIKTGSTSCSWLARMVTDVVSPPCIELSPDGSSGAVARQFVLAHLRRWSFAELADDALIVVSELVDNAVEHAAAGFQVRLHREPAGVVITVTDPCPRLPQPVTSGDPLTRPRGRGLLIIDKVAQAWGADRNADGGKIVWARLTLCREPRTEGG